MRVRLGIPRSKNQWILTLLGAAVTVGCAVPLAQGFLSLSWPKVDGVVTHSRDKAGRRVIGVDIGYRYATGGQPNGRSLPVPVRADGEPYVEPRCAVDFGAIPARRAGEDRGESGQPGGFCSGARPRLREHDPSPLGLLMLLLGLGEVPKERSDTRDSAAALPSSRGIAWRKFLR